MRNMKCVCGRPLENNRRTVVVRAGLAARLCETCGEDNALEISFELLRRALVQRTATA